MPSPFPGMDLYLENPAFWPDVHQRFITYLCDAIQPQIRPQYNARIGERIYVVDSLRSIYADLALIERRNAPPRQRRQDANVAVLEAPPVDSPVIIKLIMGEYREPFVEIYHGHTGDVVTVIEVLSPANKQPVPGRDLYLKKQREIMNSYAHLVEIDLLTHGMLTVALPAEPLHDLQPWRYLVAINRSTARGESEVYARSLSQRLPQVYLPLRAPDNDVPIDLQAILAQCYANGGYEDLIDYRTPPNARLGLEELFWIEKEIVAKL